ncbi:hypothetical protein NDR87_18885 [Nocardia sp. CDC159]|uniref:Uncharacterized protein n=1 Tax=Nocardia pulmonis TaxID=2951408 RepID=A0A9X2IYC2_9NOCA|nr:MULTISPECIES: hypothetical protein [Nocardia]MCM6776243.1 hypothetical protein [Nocardia pulmonis]MCM6788431.1 hypothetical protein [Nocardia sp. CDC159]
MSRPRKLTDQQVREILQLHRRGLSFAGIQRLYPPLTGMTVRRIVDATLYADVTDDSHPRGCLGCASSDLRDENIETARNQRVWVRCFHAAWDPF